MNYIKIPIDSVVYGTLSYMKDGNVSLTTTLPIILKPYGLLVRLGVLGFVEGPTKDIYYVVFTPEEKSVLEHNGKDWYVKVPVE